MIDAHGFRSNVGIMLANGRGQLFWARRIRHDGWQFPQGGVGSGEAPQQAMFRELQEEVGLAPVQVKVLACTRKWLHYRLPRHLIRTGEHPPCIGQKQKWFLLRMLAGDSSIRLDKADHPEFDRWCWVSYWYPLGQIVSFKREVYRQALKELKIPLAQMARRGELIHA